MALQAVTPGAGMPDLIPISPWGGLAGLSQTLAPSQEVLVVFENADPTLPRVIAYSQSGTPLVTTIDATALKLGPSATTVQLAGGGDPVALTSLVIAQLALIATAITSLGGTYTAPIDPTLIGSAKVSSG